jgi:hypothetical protein
VHHPTVGGALDVEHGEYGVVRVPVVDLQRLVVPLGHVDVAAERVLLGGDPLALGPEEVQARLADGAHAIVPRDRVLVETDAPFLTPAPHRGRLNSPYLIPHTLRVMAEVRGEDLGELCAAIDANTEAAYGGAW